MKLVLFCCFLALAPEVHAGNSLLAKESTVPTGERVANYLQSVVSSASELVNAKNRGDVFAPSTPQRFSFNYDPEAQVINVDVLGGLDDYGSAKKMLDLTQQLIFSLNKKTQKYFGVTLNADDLAMVYINVKDGVLVAKFEKGQYENKLKDRPVPTDTPGPAGGLNP